MRNLIVFTATLLLASCAEDPILSELQQAGSDDLLQPRNEIATSAAEIPDGFYVLDRRDDPDPLWRFKKYGNAVVLIADPSEPYTGIDYATLWANPFELTGNRVEFTVDQRLMIYAFMPTDDGGVEVLKTTIIRPMGAALTTETHAGYFVKRFPH